MATFYEIREAVWCGGSEPLDYVGNRFFTVEEAKAEYVSRLAAAKPASTDKRQSPSDSN